MAESFEISAYIAKLPEWQQDICKKLRRLIHEADPDVVEGFKWSSPTFEDHGVICRIFAAKEWVNLGFPNGAMLKKHHNLFEETTNKAGRSFKIFQDTKIPNTIIVQIVKEVVVNNREGKKVRFKIPKPGTQVFDLPEEYRAILEMQGVLDAYLMRPYYQQKGYVEWVDEAKQLETRERRVIVMIEELRAGVYMPSAGNMKGK